MTDRTDEPSPAIHETARELNPVTTEQVIAELCEALSRVIPILDATRISMGFGKTQLDRIEKAKAALAKAKARGAAG